MMGKGNCVSLLHGVGVFVAVVLLIQRGEARTFTVGGSKGWTVPSDNSPVYNQWAEKMRFQIGDSLLFVYPAGSDSVLQVTKEDFSNCNTNTPLEKYTDGHTEIKLNQSGPYYFISGNKDNCLKNEKLVLVVLADRSKKTPPATQSPPSPPPATTPAPAPSTVSTPPAPPPTTTMAPPPTTVASTPAPSAETPPPPPSAAPSLLPITSFLGSLGLASSLLLF